MAVASREKHSKAEVYQNGKWTEVDDFPADSGSELVILNVPLVLYLFLLELTPYVEPDSDVNKYATIYYQKFFYYFGSFKPKSSKRGEIYRLDSASWTWSSVGQLNTNSRKGHSVILARNEFWIVGGESNSTTETCKLENDKLRCRNQAQGLI